MAQPAASPKSQPSIVGGRRLGKDVADFLIEFSISVHRYSIYPTGHPTLGPAAGNLMQRLARLLENQQELSLGVAHKQLVLNGATTDRQHPVLSDLANRLHDNHIGAITFTLDVDRESLGSLLKELASADEGDVEPIGLRPPDDIPSWPGITIYPVGYRDLQLDEEGELKADDQVLQLWLGLARAAMAGTPAGDRWTDDESPPDPATVAAHLRGSKERAYDEVIVGYLLQISDQLAEGDEDFGPIRDRITELVTELDRPTLERILKTGGDAQRRRQIVRQAFRGLGGAAALKLLEAAAATSGQEISVLMLRMLTKLSFHADEGAVSLRPRVAHAVRESVDDLLEDWKLEDPNPEGYVRILDELSRASPYLKPSGAGFAFKRSALPLIQMSIEVDAYGEMVEQALDEMLIKGGLDLVAPLVEGELDSKAAQRIRDRVGSPHQIEALEEFEQVSDESLELLVEMVGPEKATAPLLRLLAESQSRSLRRTVFDRLVQMGDHVGASVTPFLEDPRWYVVRNMLELVAALPEPPAGFSALRYASHPDMRVRRAALPLALQESEGRGKALVLALREEDERMVRTGLLELRKGLPQAVAPIVVERCVKNTSHSVSLRTLAVRVLEPSRDVAVRDAILDIATSGRSLFGKPRLANTNGANGELARAALEVLVQSWSDDPFVVPLLKAAAKKRDPVVSKILEGARKAPEAVAETPPVVLIAGEVE